MKGDLLKSQKTTFILVVRLYAVVCSLLLMNIEVEAAQLNDLDIDQTPLREGRNVHFWDSGRQHKIWRCHSIHFSPAFRRLTIEWSMSDWFL